MVDFAKQLKLKRQQMENEVPKKKKKRSLIDRLKDKQAAIKAGAGSKDFHIMKAGITRVRILPVGDENDFSLEIMHFFPSKDIGGFISPATWGDPCAFMEWHNKISKQKGMEKLAKDMRPRKKFVAPAIVYNDELGKEVDTQKGVRLLLMPATVLNGMIDLFTDPENGDFTDIIEGYDLKIKRTGTTMMDTEYTVIKGKTSKLSNKYSKEIYNPEEMAKAATPSYEETKGFLEKYLNTQGAETQEGPRPLKKKKKIKKDL